MAATGRRSCRFTVRPPVSPPCLLLQDRPEPLNIPRHHRQGDIPLETIETMIRAAIQAMRLQRVDR